MKRMKKYIAIIIMFIPLIWGCSEDDFLNKETKSQLTAETVFTDPVLTLSAIGDLYDRQIDYARTDRWWEFSNFDYAFGSNGGDYWRHKMIDYDWGWFGTGWVDAYKYVREINLVIERLEEFGSTGLAEEEYIRFSSETRFLRAVFYFEMVKRFGGVPLILESLEYDYAGDPEYLQYARTSESEVYDWIIAELDELKETLPAGSDVKARATRGAALAMKSRVALYAGSIAQHGASTPEVTLEGDIVGIPASKADAYYQQALDAVTEMESDGTYSLVTPQTTGLSPADNFAEIFLNKDGNSEVIWVRDYLLEYKIHAWTQWNTPLTSSEEGTSGGRLNPSLNLVQSYELLNNTFAQFETHDANGNYILYDNPGDIFEGRDGRLAGTVLLPGAEFKDRPLDLFAGLLVPNGNGYDKVTDGNFGAYKDIDGDGQKEQVTGEDGPIDGEEFTAQTGFYIRKYLDPTIGSARIGTQSDVWWVRLRYAEVLLNGAEAAYQLGKSDVAVAFINRIRQRAGFETDLTAGELTFERIVHERKVEMVFEDHVIWDYKRWRLAHQIWDGNTSELPDPSNITGSSDRPYALIPYKVHNPGGDDHGKFAFEAVLPGEVSAGHRFRIGNYYSIIGDDVLSSNPKIVANPNQ